MKHLFGYFRPYLARISLGLSFKFFGTIMDLLLPWILAYMIDDIIPQSNIPLIFIWGGVMLICSFIAVAGNIIANRMASRVARNITQKLRHDLFAKIFTLSSRQIDHVTIPSLVARMTTDTYNIHHFVGMIQRMGVRAPILLIGGILVTLTLDPVLTLVLVSILPFITAVVYVVSKKGIPLYTGLQLSVDKLIRVVRENITGVRVIKALSKTEYEKKRFDAVNREVARNEQKAGTTMAVTNPMMDFFLNIGLSLVIIVGAFRVNSGVTEPGKIIAFLSYFTIILNAMLSVTRIFVMYSRGSASANRIMQVMEIEEDIKVFDIPEEDSPYHISFQNVSFSYNGTRNNLTDINFDLMQGETLGIIGATGSGKTTVINLLMRFYDINKGKILIHGKNINSMDMGTLRKKFGAVFQNDVLFADSISENIRFGRELTDQAVENAIACAQAKEFISAFPEKAEKQLTVNGSNLSGGQKQRVLIARALAGNPEILILDDSSSALDYKTDSLFRQAVKEQFSHTTTIIVAQRISSIMQADHIMVLDDGCITGYGTHEDLIKNCKIYQEISQSQMGDE